MDLCSIYQLESILKRVDKAYITTYEHELLIEQTPSTGEFRLRWVSL